MRTVSKAQFNIVLPLLFAAGGAACGWYFLEELRFEPPVAWVVAGVLAVSAVLLASMQKQVSQCESCLRLESMTPEEEAQLATGEKDREREQVRGELMDELRAEIRLEIEQDLRSRIVQELKPRLVDEVRPSIEQELRPMLERELRTKITDELRPRLASEIKDQVAEELRPQIALELRSQVEREVEGRLRPKIEEQVRAQFERSSAADAAARPQPPRPPTRPPVSEQEPVRSRPQTSPPQSHAAPQSEPTAPMAAAGTIIDPHARAQRRARVIVSDIQLYNKDLVEKAARSPDPAKMLDSVWAEAVHSYNETVPEDVRKNSDYLAEALEALMSKMRKEVRE